MNTLNLGAMLQALQRERIAHIVSENAVSELSLCAQRDQKMVREFFRDACVQFSNCILAGVDVRPMLLGNGHHPAVSSILMTCRWARSGDPSSAAHPFHGEWTRFAQWCHAHGLKPLIENRIDHRTRESWYAISVAARDARDETRDELPIPSGISEDSTG